MRKVGDILKKRRLEKNLTLEEVEKRTKIRKKFLLAIEKGDYFFFPSSTYVRGFIKNYSDFLNLPTEEILAIFRREFVQEEKTGILPKGLSETNPLTFKWLTPGKVSLLAAFVLLLIFFFYLLRGYLSVVGAPELVIDKPKMGEKINNERLIVEGKTDPEVKLTINNQEVLVDQDGHFAKEIIVSSSTTSVVVTAENKQGKKTTIERLIEVNLP